MASSSSLRRNKTSKKSAGMAPVRILGICLLIAGISLFLVGMATPHPVDPLAAATPGAFARASTWYALGGIGLALIGFILTIFGIRATSLRR